MRWILAVVGIVLVAGAVLLLARPRGVRQGTAEGISADGAAAPGAGGLAAGAGEAGLSEEERAALAELEAELEQAEPVEYRTDEERLADARAWVAANRPADRPYNEIEAKILALMDVLLDGEERSAEWALNMTQIEVEMIRAIDADGDGQVSDDEVQSFIDENIASMFNPMEHPYLRERFDTDGDGQTSAEEMMALSSMMNEGALSGAFERGKLEAWDSDNDGAISADERVAGERAADDRARELFGDMIQSMGAGQAEAWLGDPDQTPEERAAAREAFYAQVGDQAAEMMERQREMLLSQAAAEEFLNNLRVDDLPQPDMKEVMESMPQPPDMEAFDIDGDGAFADDERAAQAQAMQDYQQAVARWGSELTAHRLAAQFENAVSRSDRDADGRLSPGEWEERIGELLDERDRRLFLDTYDIDASGRVDAGELGRFLDWYRSGSQRADVNFDGAIDGRDLQDMALRFQGQGR